MTDRIDTRNPEEARRLRLYSLWENHCIEQRETGDARHLPISEGGKAEFSWSPSGADIHCRVKGCNWHHK